MLGKKLQETTSEKLSTFYLVQSISLAMLSALFKKH